jgi:hypothetical protein
MSSSTPDLDQQPSTPLSLTPAAPHLLPMVLLTIPALPLPLRVSASTVPSLPTACLGKVYAFAIESYGYVDKDGMDLMRALALAASSTGKVKYGSFLARASGD